MRLAAEAELAELERHTIQERAQAEADQRIREARATEDLDQRKAAGAARETRATVLAAVDAVFGYLGSGAQASAPIQAVQWEGGAGRDVDWGVKS